MIHHDTISGRMADEGGGPGHFNIVEVAPRMIQVIDGDGGMTLSEHTKRGAAERESRRRASAYDRAEVERVMRKRVRAAFIAPGTPVRVTGLGVYEGRWIVAFGHFDVLVEDSRMVLYRSRCEAGEGYAERLRVRSGRAARDTVKYRI